MTKIPPQHYFDYAAATPLDRRVYDTMQPFVTEEFANPSSLYAAGRKARKALEEARARAARLIGAKKAEIIFTAGATESINLAIAGVLHQFPGAGAVTTSIEHDAVLATARAMVSSGHELAICSVGKSGIVDAALLMSLVTDNTVLVSLMLANNEIGTIQPVADVARLVAAVRADRQSRGINLPLYLHSDASAGAVLLSLQVSRLGVDLMTINAAKIYGPKASGLLYVRAGTRLSPLTYGGGQERGLRAGSESVASAVGLVKALELVGSDQKAEVERLTELRDHLLEGFAKTTPDFLLNGHPTRRLASNINITIPGLDGETAVLYLDEAGIQLATGSACSASDDQPSHVLMAIGLSLEQASSSLRLTLGRGTTLAGCDHLIQVVSEVRKKLASFNAHQN